MKCHSKSITLKAYKQQAIQPRKPCTCNIPVQAVGRMDAIVLFHMPRAWSTSLLLASYPIATSRFKAPRPRNPHTKCSFERRRRETPRSAALRFREVLSPRYRGARSFQLNPGSLSKKILNCRQFPMSPRTRPGRNSKWKASHVQKAERQAN